MSQNKEVLKAFFQFLEDCPSYFHVIQAMEKKLQMAGFKKLSEKENFTNLSDGKYFIIRNNMALAAFRKQDKNPTGFRIIGSHTDSPALRVKPSPNISYKNYISLGVEVYGGPVLSTWFDRDLSIAGRVCYLEKDGNLNTALIDFKKPVALIPGLAAHLRKRDGDEKLNRQKELPPILMQSLEASDINSFEDILKKILLEENGISEVEEILDHDLFLYDTQKAAKTGLNCEFVSAGKLDNLLSTFAGLKALIDAKDGQNTLLIANCHEEVGSSTDTGAGGTFLENILERICGDREKYFQTLASSFLISVDNAHAVHPNYAEKHDSKHLPELNKGPVIKVNANQRYITTGKSSSVFKMLCKSNDIPYQIFVSRSDMPCGSTIGPITATRLGIEALDIGAPTFAMHSIREVCGATDIPHMYTALKAFYQSDLNLSCD